jgi:hypothetical protein
MSWSKAFGRQARSTVAKKVRLANLYRLPDEPRESAQLEIDPAMICQRSRFFSHTRMNFSVPVN